MTLTKQINLKSAFPSIKRLSLNTLQVNLGYKCNQTCIHCHVNAGPHRKEMMNPENISLIPEVLKLYEIKQLDLTGGAPELHPQFRELVTTARQIGTEVIDRCNLTILSEPMQEDLAIFLAEKKVIIVASLPCYEEYNVDKQRGGGVFNKSIDGLQKLNKLGYGKKNSGLELNLVYNPQGPNLPPPQNTLENKYRKELLTRYNIEFNSLYTIANMPIQRFAYILKMNNELYDYMKLLKDSHNPNNLDSVMCRELISVDWQGALYDCDFNQQLGLKRRNGPLTIQELIKNKNQIKGTKILVGNHCFGCTAGAGSSCGGELA